MVMESEPLVLEKYGTQSMASKLGTKRPCNFHFCSLTMFALRIQPPCKKLRHFYRMTKATWRESLETERSSLMFWPWWILPGADDLPS